MCIYLFTESHAIYVYIHFLPNHVSYTYIYIHLFTESHALYFTSNHVSSMYIYIYLPNHMLCISCRFLRFSIFCLLLIQLLVGRGCFVTFFLLLSPYPKSRLLFLTKKKIRTSGIINLRKKIMPRSEKTSQKATLKIPTCGVFSHSIFLK